VSDAPAQARGSAAAPFIDRPLAAPLGTNPESSGSARYAAPCPAASDDVVVDLS
jgi:hypothetical protein